MGCVSAKQSGQAGTEKKGMPGAKNPSEKIYKGM